jgi:hypothetical protein
MTIAARFLPIATALTAATIIVSAQAKAPRTAWGTPDLQGIWNTNTFVTLERAPQFGTRAMMTEDEQRRRLRPAGAQQTSRP